MLNANDAETVDQLAQAVKERKLIPFIGPQISRFALPTMPDPRQLMSELVEEALATGYLIDREAAEIGQLLSERKYFLAASELKYRYPADAYHAFLVSKFDRDVEPPSIHRAILRLNAPLIITTNYDHLLEDAYASEYRKQPIVLTYKDAAQVSEVLSGDTALRSTMIWKIHGSIDEPWTVILSEHDHREVLYRQPHYRDVLSEVFVASVILAVGYEDENELLIWTLRERREAVRSHDTPDFMLVQRGRIAEPDADEFRASFGLEVIQYDSPEALVALFDSLPAANGEHEGRR